jgi:hypothetical protein
MHNLDRGRFQGGPDLAEHVAGSPALELPAAQEAGAEFSTGLKIGVAELLAEAFNQAIKNGLLAASKARQLESATLLWPCSFANTRTPSWRRRRASHSDTQATTD